MRIASRKPGNGLIVEEHELAPGFEPRGALREGSECLARAEEVALELVTLLRVLLVREEIAQPELRQVVALAFERCAGLFERSALRVGRCLTLLCQPLKAEQPVAVEPLGGRDLFEKADDLAFELSCRNDWLAAVVLWIFYKYIQLNWKEFASCFEYYLLCRNSQFDLKISCLNFLILVLFHLVVLKIHHSA